MALDPEPLEPEPDDVLEPPELEPPLDGGDERGGGADRTGWDCGMEEVGASRTVDPPPAVEDPELGGGASLEVVVRGMA